MFRNTKIASATKSAGGPMSTWSRRVTRPMTSVYRAPTPMKAKIVPVEPVYVPKPRPPIR
jgi:hypothetical protein